MALRQQEDLDVAVGDFDYRVGVVLQQPGGVRGGILMVDTVGLTRKNFLFWATKKQVVRLEQPRGSLPRGSLLGRISRSFSPRKWGDQMVVVSSPDID